MVNSSSSSPDAPVAKSRPRISLSAHTDRVERIATELIDSPAIEHRLKAHGLDTANRSRLVKLASIAASYHDTGKAHPDWQARCLNGKTPPPHSARSAFYTFAARESLNRSDDEISAVILAILHHHTPFATDHMKPRTIDGLGSLTGPAGDEMLDNLHAAGYPDVSFTTEEIQKFKTHLKYCREELTPSQQQEQYQRFGFLVTVLRAVLIQADQYASAREKGSEASLPKQLTPADISLHEPLRPFQKQIENSVTQSLLGLAGCGEGKTQTAFQWGKRMIESGKADRLIFAMPTQITTNNLLF